MVYPPTKAPHASNTLSDNKEAGRVDINTRYGTFFGYYFMDNDTVGNPYAGGTAGGFPAVTTGRAQMANLGLTTTFKNNSVNTFRFTYMRSATHIEPAQLSRWAIACVSWICHALGTGGRHQQHHPLTDWRAPDLDRWLELRYPDGDPGTLRQYLPVA